MIKLISANGVEAVVEYQGKTYPITIKLRRDSDKNVWISALTESTDSLLERGNYLGIPMDNQHIIIKNYGNTAGALELLLEMGLIAEPIPIANTKLFIVTVTPLAETYMEETEAPPFLTE